MDTSQPDKLYLLAKVHPLPDPHDSLLPTLPLSATLATIPADDQLVKLLSQLVNGSAPGPSGWTFEMVKTLSSDPECLSGLALLLQDITNGTLPRSIKPFLLSSNLIGLDKNQGQSVRPIAIGEVFYRIGEIYGTL